MRNFIKMIVMLTFCFGASFASSFTVDPSHSEMGFSVKHLMITNVKGKFDFYIAKIDFDEKKKVFSSVSAVLDAGSINTENKKRDKHLAAEDFFDAKKFNDIKFVMTSYEKIDDEHGKMSGDLTIKGTTKPIVLDAEIGGIAMFRGVTKIGFMLSGEISRKEFGLNWNKALESGGVVVGDKVKLLIEVEANKKN